MLTTDNQQTHTHSDPHAPLMSKQCDAIVHARYGCNAAMPSALFIIPHKTCTALMNQLTSLITS
jgi:hypothetical protein